MLMLPMDIGETTLIQTPQGETIKVYLSQHRTSRDQPIIGFQTPDNYLTIRNTLLQKLEAFLQTVTLYQVCSDQSPTALLAARNDNHAIRHYQRHYPAARQIQLQPAEQPLPPLLYHRLANGWLRQTQAGVLLVEV